MHQFFVSCGMERFLMKMGVEKGDTSRRAHLFLNSFPFVFIKGAVKCLRFCVQNGWIHYIHTSHTSK